MIARLYQRLLRGEEKILAARSVARTLDDLEQIQRWEQVWTALLEQYERTCDHLKEIKQAQTRKEVVF